MVTAGIGLRLTIGVALISVAMAGCGSHQDQGAAAPPPRAPSSSPPDLSSTQTQAAAAALSAYETFRKDQAAAMRTATYNSAMAKVAGDPLLGDQIHGLETQKQSGVVFRGSGPRWAPTVAGVDLVSSPPSVTIEDCLDMSDFYPVVDGKRASVPAAQQHLHLTAEVKNERGVWYVYKIVQGSTC